MASYPAVPTTPGRKGTVVQFDKWNGYHLPNPTTPGRKGTVVQFDIEAPPASTWSVGTLRFGGSGGWR